MKRPLLNLGLSLLLLLLTLAYSMQSIGERMDNCAMQSFISKEALENRQPIKQELAQLLQAEEAKYSQIPDLNTAIYPRREGEKPGFVQGYFMLSPLGYFAPEPVLDQQEADFAYELRQNSLIIDSARRKAGSPSAPLVDPDDDKGGKQQGNQLPLFSIYTISSSDLSKDIKQMGKASNFFVWQVDERIIYMRGIPSDQGPSAEGLLIDKAALESHLFAKLSPALRALISLKVDNNISILVSNKPEQEANAELRRQITLGIILSIACLIYLLGAIIDLIISLWHNRARGIAISQLDNPLDKPSNSPIHELLAKLSERLPQLAILPDKRSAHGHIICNQSVLQGLMQELIVDSSPIKVQALLRQRHLDLRLSGKLTDKPSPRAHTLSRILGAKLKREPQGYCISLPLL